MQLRRRRKQDVVESIDAAARASRDSGERLADARHQLAGQRERARIERITIIAAIRRMREQDNLARLILDSVEREAGSDAGTARGGAD
jgi:hypothetical protein